MLYNVGDFVMIRDWDDMVNEYGAKNSSIDVPFSFTSPMRRFCGKEFQIVYIEAGEYKGREASRYHLDGCAGWIFSEEMFEREDNELNSLDIASFDVSFNECTGI